jgi:uncharacterized protein involved in outer membrane biogenesis
MRKLLFGFIGIVVIAVGAALIVPSIIDWNGYKAEIASQVRQATGRELQINGDLDLAILPSPRLSAIDVRFANLKGATAPHMAQLKSLQVSVRLAPLLSGKVEVESISLIGPIIELERLSDGRTNWDLVPKTENSTASSSSATENTAAGGQSESIRLDSIHIEDGTIIYRDSAEEMVEKIENLNLEISAKSLSGPFVVDGGLTVRGIPLEIATSVGKISGPGPAAIKLGVRVPNTQSEIDLTGALNQLNAKPRLKGKISAKGPDLAKLFTAITRSPQPEMLRQDFTLNAQIDASAKAIAIDGIALSFGGTHANGGVNAVLGEKLQADIALRIGRIDLDKLLAINPASSSKSDAATANQAADMGKPKIQSGFALPKNINGTLDLAVDAATFKGGQIRGIKFAASLNDGELTLNQVTARLPGGAEASLFGFLIAKKGKPDFDGSVDLRADNLRAVMSWLKVDTSTIPADRLRKFSFAAKVAGNPAQIQLSKINMRLDASRIKGGVTYALGRARPGFGARFSIDHLNLDAYAPATGKKTKPQSSHSGDVSNAPAQSSSSPLSILTGIDANLNLRIGTLNFRHTPIQGIRLSSTLFNGKLAIREARIRSLAGTAISIKGSVEGFASLPVFKGSFAADSQDISGLTRVLNIKTPVPAKRYGRLKFNGRADAAADKIVIRSSLQLAGAKAAINGTLSNLQKSPRFDLKFAANHPEFSRLAPLLGAELPSGKRRYGLFGLNGQFSGDMNTIDMDTQIKAAGAKISLTGRVTNPVTAAKIDASFNLSHPSLTRLMRTLNPNYRPAREKLGPVKLSSLIKGTNKAINLETLRATIGPLQIEGDGKLALEGAKPMLTASLASGEIDLNLLLPADSAGAAPKGPGAVIGAPAAASRGAAQGRFSRAPYDFGSLDIIDADIKLAARAIIWDTFRVDGPQLAATIKNKTLTVSKLAGRMFEGAFDMTGKLVGAGVPTINGKVRIDRANVGKALFQSGNFDIEGGILNYDMALSARGRSEFDMISSLNGDGRVNVRDGIVKGFDLAAVSNRLKNLNRATDILGLFGSAMGGGATRFSTLNGTVQIRNGVVRTKDMKLLADAGEGLATGFVDLPRWNMDMIAQFRLTEHPKAPPFGMRVTGRPDNPKRLFKFEQMQAFLLQRGIGSLLNEVLKRRSKSQPSGQPQQQQQRTRPEDLIRGLLQGLK